LFSSLEATLGSLRGRRLLDLYAGSGAVGVEALSRGAVHVLLVESDGAAAEIARRNLADTGLSGGQVVRRRVERVVAEPAPGPAYDVVFADPPYELPAPELGAVLAEVVRNGWLAAGGLAVVERSSRDRTWEWPTGIVGDRERRYGEGCLWYGRAADPPS
jgi:16S rRNA (guanine966-N2)-methyltransferase